MEILIYIFKLSAGIGLFLFAMYLLEESLKNLTGRKAMLIAVKDFLLEEKQPEDFNEIPLIP